MSTLHDVSETLRATAYTRATVFGPDDSSVKTCVAMKQVVDEAAAILREIRPELELNCALEQAEEDAGDTPATHHRQTLARLNQICPRPQTPKTAS